MTQSRRGSRASRLTIKLTAVVAVLVLLIVAILVPRYRSFVATVDDQHRWRTQQAPSRREIVWQPAEPVKTNSLGSGAGESHLRPQVTADGNFLFFTVRTANNDLDIVRSKRTAKGWSKPEPVAALNTDFDDVGPVIGGDRETLYLYSNRDGGFGGMDLYASRREGGSWRSPVNLGKMINTPAHEYDPAISPDAKRLFYSSNRSKQMQRRLIEGGLAANNDHWSTTLRRDLGNRTFDLYASEFDSQSKQWNHGEPLDWLNTRDFNEGAAFVSPDGAFLLFASDRPSTLSDRRNFDIYRARIDRPGRPVENIGVGINTSANETEPCLVDPGFKLMFSRSDADNPAWYSLYQSTAQEIYQDAEWDQSNLKAWGGVLRSAVKRIFDRWWLLLLMLVAIASLIWLLRQIAVRRVAVPGFLLAALILHVLLMTGSFFVYFQQQFAKKLKEMFEDEAVVATQVLLSSTDPTPTEQPSFEPATSLQMPAPIQPAEHSRRAVDVSPHQRPIELAKPQQIANRVPLPADFDGQRVTASVAVPDSPATSKDLLPRAKASRQPPNDSIRLAQTVAVEAATIEPIPNRPRELERQDLQVVDDPVQKAPVKELVIKHEPVATDELHQRAMDPKAMEIESKPVEISLRRAAFVDAERDDSTVNPAVPAEKVMAVEAETMKAPASQNVEVDRSQPLANAAVAQPEPLKLATASEALPKPVRSKTDLPTVVADDHGIAKEGVLPASPLKRARASTRTPASEAEADSPLQMAAQKPMNAPPSSTTTVDVARESKQDAPLLVGQLAVTSSEKTPRLIGVTPQRLTPLRSAPFDSKRRDLLGGISRRQSSRVFADVKVNLQSLLQRRKLDEATKLEVVKEFGGNDQTLQAIRRGLNWVAQHQHADGHWGLRDFNRLCKDHKKCSGHGSSRSDTAGTALALLPFLGDGNTHQEGPYKDAVAGGVAWLIKHQKPDGNLFTGGEGNSFMYSHGIATIALCECYGMTGDRNLRDPAQRAINFIIAAQDPKTGGWRYRPRERGDTSVVGWQVMALKSGQMADLTVSETALKESQRWLASVSGAKNRVGQFAYQRNNKFNPAMTAEAILCLEYLDNDRAAESLVRGAEYLLRNLPRKNVETSYYWYYGTQSMFHLQGEHWRRWNESIHPLLIDSQRQDGPMAGTWDPRDQWERSGGRIYSTSLRILMLEVYYRHLPLYQVID